MKKAYGTRARYGLLFFLTASLLAASSPALARTGEKVQLAGRWKFNPQVSDDSEQKVREALRTNRPPADGRDHTYPGGAPRGTTGYPGVGTDTQVPGGGVEVGDPQGIGRGGEGTSAGEPTTPVIFPGGTQSDPGTRGGGGGQGRPANPGSRSAIPGWKWLSRNPQFLQIDQRAREVVITDDSGNAQTYYPDGKKHEDKDAKGNKISTKAQWEGNSLIAETRLSPSETLTETFRLSEDRNQIYVKTRYESASLSGGVSIRRVYDLAKAANRE